MSTSPQVEDTRTPQSQCHYCVVSACRFTFSILLMGWHSQRSQIKSCSIVCQVIRTVPITHHPSYKIELVELHKALVGID